jgi:hypothetical protein
VSGGVILPSIGTSLREICREHISGKCTSGRLQVQPPVAAAAHVSHGCPN